MHSTENKNSMPKYIYKENKYSIPTKECAV